MAENALIKALQNETLYDHPIKNFQVFETHISWVILTGDFAYKIKKPINLGFADFSTLEKRKFFCEAEFELNQPLASELYIGVIPITGKETSPHLNEKGPIIEYALKMKQFDQNNLLKTLLARTPLTSHLIQSIAQKIAHFHLQTPSVMPNSAFGNPKLILDAALDNFVECEVHINNSLLSKQLQEIKQWTLDTFKELNTTFEHRKQSGFIRGCHGDLHLGNMILMNKHVIIFDCIEFNPAFRFIDIMNDISFLAMDLSINEIKDSYRLLNAYLEITGDYEGIRVLRFYTIYRAMVRAKIALLTKQTNSLHLFQTYCSLAIKLLKKTKPSLIIMHGFSGSGKTSIATQLIPYLMACRVRSDVERKRIFNNSSDTKILGDLYSETMTETTYQRLVFLAECILNEGYSVIIDASFLKYHHRHLFQILAQQLEVPFLILNCIANPPTLQKRIKNRLTEEENVSDATLEVLSQQYIQLEPLTKEESTFSLSIHTDHAIDIEHLGIENILRQQNRNF